MSEDKAGIQRKVLSGFAWLGTAKLLTQILSWVGTVIVARILAPADYGLVALASVFLGLAEVVMEAGVTEGLIQKNKTTRREEDGVFYINMVLALSIYGLAWFSAPAIAALYGMPELAEIIRVFGIGVVFLALRHVPYALAMQRMDYRYAATVETIGQLGGTISLISFAVAGQGAWSLVWAYLIKNVLVTSLYFFQFERIPLPLFSWHEVRDVLWFGFRLMLSQLMRFVYMRADVFIIGKVLGERATGLFDMAYQLATIPLDKIGSIFNRVAMPAVSKVKNDVEHARTLFLDMHHYLLLFASPMLIGMALVAEDFIVVLLTDKWLVTAKILEILCIINLLRLSNMLIPPILAARGHANRILRYHLCCFVLLPPAFAIGVKFGVIGVALSWLVAFPLAYGLLLRDVLNDLEIQVADFWRSVYAPLGATLLMALAVIAVKAQFDPGILRLAATVVTGVVSYAAAIGLLFPNEIERARQGIATLRGRPAVD